MNPLQISNITGYLNLNYVRPEKTLNSVWHKIKGSWSNITSDFQSSLGSVSVQLGETVNYLMGTKHSRVNSYNHRTAPA